MAHVFKNPNPKNNLVGDCVIRGISILMNRSWEYTYIEIVTQGYRMFDMPSSNAVWGAYLKSKGYKRHPISDAGLDCYSVKQFCNEHPHGRYLLATGTHVVASVDGDYYDTWDSGDEVPIYYFTREE